MIDPNWIVAAAGMVTAAEGGVVMFKKSETAPAAPTGGNGISGSEYLLGMLILAIAMLGAAAIIHHGLVA